MNHAQTLNGHDGPSHQGRADGSDTVKTPLTSNRAGRVRENDEYAAIGHVLRAYARRVATATSRPHPDDRSRRRDRPAAVTGLRAFGYSWTEIGSRLGITRQAAQQRWGRTS